MNEIKREALKQAGFQVGTVQEFLGLNDWENQFVELKYRLCKQAKSLREIHGLTQQNVARKIQSSQSRVAKIEAGSADVSLELIIRYFYAVGGRLEESGTEESPPQKQTVKGVTVGLVGGAASRKKPVSVS